MRLQLRIVHGNTINSAMPSVAAVRSAARDSGRGSLSAINGTSNRLAGRISVSTPKINPAKIAACQRPRKCISVHTKSTSKKAVGISVITSGQYAISPGCSAAMPPATRARVAPRCCNATRCTKNAVAAPSTAFKSGATNR